SAWCPPRRRISTPEAGSLPRAAKESGRHPACGPGILQHSLQAGANQLSFFEEGGETRRPRPRRPARGGVAAPPDQQTARVRQGVAAGVILLVVILLVVGIRGCLNSAKKRSLREYNDNVRSLVQESDDQV